MIVRMRLIRRKVPWLRRLPGLIKKMLLIVEQSDLIVEPSDLKVGRRKEEIAPSRAESRQNKEVNGIKPHWFLLSSAY